MPCWVTISNHSGARAHLEYPRPGAQLDGQRRQPDGSDPVPARGKRRDRAGCPCCCRWSRCRPASLITGTHSLQVEGYGADNTTVAIPIAERHRQAPARPSSAWATPWPPRSGNRSRRNSPVERPPGRSHRLARGPGAARRGLAGACPASIACGSPTPEYTALDAARRAAIRHWVDQGGMLYLCTQTLDPSLRAGLGLPETGDAAHPGLGSSCSCPWDGKPLLPRTAADTIIDARSRGADRLRRRRTGAMTNAVGTHPAQRPVSDRVHRALRRASSGRSTSSCSPTPPRRHRLVLDDAADLRRPRPCCSSWFIVLQDGFGGTGERVMVTPAFARPEKGRRRAGTGRAHRRAALAPVHAWPKTSCSRRCNRPSAHCAASTSRPGRDYGGDWFASRSVQAQRAEAIVPSRAEIQLVNADAARGGAPPVVVSSIPAALREISYLDTAGTALARRQSAHGRADHPAPGEPSVRRRRPWPSGSMSAYARTSKNRRREHARLFRRRGGRRAVFRDAALDPLEQAAAVFAGPVTCAR